MISTALSFCVSYVFALFVLRAARGHVHIINQQALQQVPLLAEELEADLTLSLKAYGEHLAAVGQPGKALWLYDQVRYCSLRVY